MYRTVIMSKAKVKNNFKRLIEEDSLDCCSSYTR